MNESIQTPDKAATGNFSLSAALAKGQTTFPQYGSKRDVGQMIKMSPRTVDNLVAQGMPHLRISSRRLRFDMAEVRQWLADNFRTQRRGGSR